MRKVSYIIFSAALVFTIAAAAVAQETTPTPPDDRDDPVSVFEVRLPITVEKKKVKKREERLVTNLKASDFLIYEDGVLQDVTFFTDEKSNPPVYVGVLMDTSPSTSGKLNFSKEAAKNFIYTVVQLRKDQAAFMTFDHRVNLIQDFTDKLDRLDRAVDTVKDTGSQTAMYDAIWQFADEKLRSVPGRRVIVIITDGDDTFSRAELEDAVDIAQRTETTIFGISTKAGFLGTVPGVEAGTVKDKGDKLLERLCEETGGRAFFTGDMLELERAFTRISKELKSQYIVTYQPRNQTYDGQSRKRQIEVKFRDPSMSDKYEIRTKKEYRAIKDSLR
ncbi:MAG: VWA domain-containing protein [Acidobacteria bacterium]|nr:MAG: VWA domain-containing protein [Acidobacteriota bacterium]REJ99128.1 MAG: VWA domain-containing protein [Acidobacteriota bacterium]REK16151.1 MAG: VWA domain-containing protein [Acidobacteriota bacterium]REK43832.1 MAG: VWA domain-containing protein [Acidobacteriota bacterium]